MHARSVRSENEVGFENEGECGGLSPPQRFDGALFVSAERSECRRKS